MYTVLIAEDELLVRMGLTVSIPWEQMNLQIVGEAASGQDAWRIYQERKPDIILTDIRMPGMDGLELIRAVRAVDSRCAIVVITCVEHFQTLHDLLDMNIVAYLIKATMSQQDITTALQKACAALDGGQSGAVVQQAGKQVQQLPHAAAPDVSGLLRSYVRDRSLTYAQFQAQAGFGLEASAFGIARLSRHDSIPELARRTLLNMLMERLKPHGVTHFVDSGHYLFALMAHVPDDAVDEKLQDLRVYMRDNFDIDIYFVLSSSIMQPEAFPAFFDMARHWTFQTRLIGDAIIRLDTQGHIHTEEIDRFFDTLRENIWYFRQHGSVLAVAECIDALEASLSGDLQEIQKKVFLLAQYLQHNARDEVEPIQFVRFMEQIPSSPNASALLELLYHQLVRPMLNRRVATDKHQILRAVAYLQENIRSKPSLADAAAVVNLHPVYFSNLFKSEIGMSFSDFTTRLQLEKSCMLLRTTMKSMQEIADECGFTDVSYFSRKFKQEMGVSPRQWRKNE